MHAGGGLRSHVQARQTRDWPGPAWDLNSPSRGTPSAFFLSRRANPSRDCREEVEWDIGELKRLLALEDQHMARTWIRARVVANNWRVTGGTPGQKERVRGRLG